MMKKKSKSKHQLAQKVLCSVLAAGILGISGNSYAAIVYDTFELLVNDSLEGKAIPSPKGYYRLFTNGGTIIDSQYLNNTVTSNNTYLFGGIYHAENTTKPDQIILVNNTIFDGNTATVNKDHVWANGGVIYLKGTITSLVDVDFKNNKIKSDQLVTKVNGGAIYLDCVSNDNAQADGNLTFTITKDNTYIGNNISASNYNVWYGTYGVVSQSTGGFLFIERNSKVNFDIRENATLTIGNINPEDENEDSIASGIPTSDSVDFAEIVKSGSGVLTINSSLNDYYGTFTVEKGTLNVTKDWNVYNTITLKGDAESNLNNISLKKLSGSVDAYYSTQEKGNFVFSKDTQSYNLKESAGSISTEQRSVLNVQHVEMEAGTFIEADGEVNISNGLKMTGDNIIVALNKGGSINTAGEYAAVSASGTGTTFTSTDVDLTGDVEALNGASITINSGSIANGGISATGNGSVILNGEADNTYVVNALAVEGDNSKIEVNGGKLVAENLRELTNNNVKENGIVLQNNGIIETKADQIFAKGVDVTSNETVLNSKDVGSVTNSAVKYVGGTLNLTDEKYGLDYVNSAKETIAKESYDETGSNTKIVMTGTLITASGENTVTSEEAASVGNSVALDKVTVEAGTGKNLIVGVDTLPKSAVEGITVEEFAKAGFNAGKLNLAKDSDGLIITDGENVTLGGSSGGEVITVNGATPTGDGVKVVVGLSDDTSLSDVTNKTGIFTIGNALATNDTKYTLTGRVKVNNGSEFIVNGTANITKGVNLDRGTIDASNGTLDGDVSIKNNLTEKYGDNISTIIGKVQINNLVVEKGSKKRSIVHIGNEEGGSDVTVKNANVNEQVMFISHKTDDYNNIGDASKLAVAADDNGQVTIDGLYLGSHNSLLSFGTNNNEKAQEVFAKTGLNWNKSEIASAMYVDNNVDISDGYIRLRKDSSIPNLKKGTLLLMENSLLLVNGENVSGNNSAAITGVNKSPTINANSKLYIDGVQKGTYHILAGDNVNEKGWEDSNILSDNSLLVLKGVKTTNAFDVEASYQSVASAFGAGAVVIPTVIDETLANQSAGDAAFDFFNDAVSTKTNATKAAQVNALNSLANMGELAGINHGTYSMSNTMTDAVAHHLSLATHGEQDKDIWAHYIHNKEDVDGMSLGGVDANYDAQFNGIVVGSDLYKNGKTTAGIALSYADGNINGYNGIARSKNDAEYYGATLYGRIENDNSAVLGDITYMHSDNDVTQTNSGHEITASADADAFSIGVRAEQAIKAGAGKFVPYAGLRYMHLGAGNYTNSLGMEYNADDQNLWLLPVGVTYSAQIASGDWTLKPIAEVGYVWTMGDRETDQTVYLNGAADSFGFETADSGSFISRFGLEAQNGSMTYGLGYEYQKGDSVKANRWLVNMVYSF